jgi:regulatory protein
MLTGHPRRACALMVDATMAAISTAATDIAGTVSALQVQARNPRRVNVFLDGTYAFALSLEVATQAGLKPGLALTGEQVAALEAQDTWQKTYDATLSFLSYRPRSETEVQRYLSRRKVPAEICKRVLARLKESGLVDDEAFARFWVENRDAFSPRSARALRSELRSKGISSDTIDAQVAGDDSDAAYRAATKKLRSLAGADKDTFRSKLLSFLQRRGFGYETSREVVNRLWRERLEHIDLE